MSSLCQIALGNIHQLDFNIYPTVITNILPVSLFDIFVGLSVFSVIPALLVYIVRWKSCPPQYHFIALYLVSTLLLDMLIQIGQLRSTTTIIFNNLFSVVSFLTLAGFYNELIFKKRARHVMILSLFIFLLASIFFAFMDPFKKPLMLYWMLNGSMIIVFSTIYIALLPSMRIERFFDKFLYSNVIISVFILMYFAIAIIIFGCAQFVFTQLSSNDARLLWTSHNTINIIKNFGIAIGLFLAGKRVPYMSFQTLESLGRKKIL